MHNKYKSQIISIIDKHAPGCKIYLYGSRARNEQKQGSDIDIALDAGKKLPFLIPPTIKEEIEEETTLPIFIDVIDVHAVDDSFKEEIMKDWILWND